MESNQKENKCHFFRKSFTAPAVFAAIVSAIFGIFSLIISNHYNRTLLKIDTNQRYVEIAVSILRDNPTEESLPLRKWATTLINTCAPEEAKLDSTAIDALLKYPIYFIVHTSYKCPDGSSPDWDGNCPPSNN